MTQPAESLAATYKGPTEFVGPDRTLRPIRFHIEAAAPVPAGTRFRMVLGWWRSLKDNNPQTDRQWHDFRATAEDGGAVAAIRQPPHGFREIGPAKVAEHPGHHAVGVAEVTETVPAGGRITLAVDGMLSHQAPNDARLFVDVAEPEAEDFAMIGEPVALYGVPGETTRIEARLKAGPDSDGRFPLHVHGADAVCNPSEPAVDLESLEVEILGAAKRVGAKVEPTADEPVRVRVRDPRRDYESLSNPIRRAPFNGRRVYFGEFHWHSRHADGDRPAYLGYEYARDTLGLDFAAVTDHTPIPVWEQTKATNERFNEPGRFVTLPAWEWSTPTGHSNIYLRTPDVPYGPEHHASADHPGNAEWPDDAIVVPHHTNIRAAERRDDGSRYWHEFNWQLPNRRVRLVEIGQTRGNFEADQVDGDWGIVTGGIGASVQDALAMGYRVGFVAGTDNHSAFPTRNADMEEDFVGMACILADDLSRESLWQAMDARRTYATSGKPILAHWTVNGLEMGSEGTLAGDAVRFNATLHGTAPIERVEVISNGAVVWRAHPDTYDFIVDDETLPTPDNTSAYYYLRLRQHDGHRAWLSPIWLDRS